MLTRESPDQVKSQLEFLKRIYIFNEYLGTRHSGISYTEKDRNIQQGDLMAFKNIMEMICK